MKKLDFDAIFLELFGWVGGFYQAHFFKKLGIDQANGMLHIAKDPVNRGGLLYDHMMNDIFRFQYGTPRVLEEIAKALTRTVVDEMKADIETCVSGKSADLAFAVEAALSFVEKRFPSTEYDRFAAAGNLRTNSRLRMLVNNIAREFCSWLASTVQYELLDHAFTARDIASRLRMHETNGAPLYHREAVQSDFCEWYWHLYERALYRRRRIDDTKAELNESGEYGYYDTPKTNNTKNKTWVGPYVLPVPIPCGLSNTNK